jgi:hypothetical protein
LRDPANSESSAAPHASEAAEFGVPPESDSPATEAGAPEEEWNRSWRQLLAESRTTARDEDLVTLIEELAATDPLRAIAAADSQADPELRRELLEAALRGWGGAKPEDAITWIKSRNTLNEDEAIAAVFHGAARNPDSAVLLARKLSGLDPDRDYGSYLVAGLSRAGEFSKAVEFAMSGDEVRLDWVRSAYARWSDSEPQAALKSIAQLSDPVAQRIAFDTAISRWGKTDPKALGAYALELPEGYDRTLALSVALRAWSVSDSPQAAEWMLHFDPSPELDFGAATIASLPETLRQPEIATSWAESIVDPRLRVRVLATIVNEWAAVDLSSARNYALTSPRIRPEDRPGVLAAFEPGFKPIALAP